MAACWLGFYSDRLLTKTYRLKLSLFPNHWLGFFEKSDNFPHVIEDFAIFCNLSDRFISPTPNT
ncbi:MAG: hypothetical protein KFF72_17825 [Arthrospira sp. SH-MAG29]|nr:hypothetical protein [Arthrospira sp. SH-MAG29]MBS0018182.1 hypothetical protein [Arthrospira sp. SH-MAG29]